MRHFKIGNDETLVILDTKEINIIDEALNNRMEHLDKVRKSCVAQKEEQGAIAMYKAWCETLDLLCEWFKVSET